MYKEIAMRLLCTVVGALLSWIGSRASGWWSQRRRFAQQRQLLHALETSTGAREVVLMLSAREEIRESVLDYLKTIGRQNLPQIAVHRPGLFSKEEREWFAFSDQIKQAIREIRELGVNRIHLFLNVPVAMAVFAGAALANGPAVVIHQFFNGAYHPIGSLTQDTVKL
jgi:hypothetical protein